MSKIRNVFSGWFSSSESDETTTPSEEVGGENEVTQSVLVSNPRPSFSIAGQAVQPDPAYVQVVMDEIEKANMDGVDYFELREAAGELVSGGLAIEVALKNAFTTLRAVDRTLTIAKLLSSSNHYIRVLTDMKTRFISESNEQLRLREQQLGTFKKDLEALVSTLNDDELEQKFLASNKGILEESLMNAKQHQENRQAKMVLVCDYVMTEISNDQALIQRVLEGGVK